MKQRIILLILLAAPAFAQRPADADRLAQAYQDRVLTEGSASLKTDDRISMFVTLVSTKPENLHYQNLLAGAYIQKVRESMDYSYLDRASKLLNEVLSQDSRNYEAARLRTEVALERHDFKLAAEYSKALTEWAPYDSWNWGTLGDAWIEMGDYDKAAEAYQKMVDLHPDLASYNRAAYFRFLNNDLEAAIKFMKLAISSGSLMAENTAWCQVELGKMYLKTGHVADAQASFEAALRYFPSYHTALAGLAQAKAEQKDWKGAIASMKLAQKSTPMPDYAAALYDYYTALGQTEEAQKQKEMVQIIDRLGQAGNEKANRNLAIIYADHDWNVARALELAQAELDVRRDIYTYDALAWALYKNHKYQEADEAMAKALRFHSPEPNFYMHARLIAEALGEKVMKSLLLFAIALPAFAGDLDRFLDVKLDYTPRNVACAALRGDRTPEVIAVMRASLANIQLQQCAATNLRVAGAAKELLDALNDHEPTARAVAARELGSLHRSEFLAPLRKAAEDPDLLVASNAIEGLVRYEDHSSAPQLREIALMGGVMTSLALDNLIDWHDPEVLTIARKLIDRTDPGDRLVGIRAIGITGDRSDIPKLREFAKDSENLAAGGRGFGLMPAISISKAAATAIQNLTSATRAAEFRPE